jgi:hypothetical protein
MESVVYLTYRWMLFHTYLLSIRSNKSVIEGAVDNLYFAICLVVCLRRLRFRFVSLYPVLHVCPVSFILSHLTSCVVL